MTSDANGKLVFCWYSLVIEIIAFTKNVLFVKVVLSSFLMAEKINVVKISIVGQKVTGQKVLHPDKKLLDKKYQT